MPAADHSFLAPVGAVTDWRMVLVVSAAADAGLLDALPGRPGEIAGRLGLDEHAVMVVLEALALFGVVEAGADGTFSAAAAAPDDDAGATLYHHARAIGLWAGSLAGRLHGERSEPGPPQDRPDRWLDSLAVNARRNAPASVDACLAHRPGTRSVLDLGGGHGEYALEFARRGVAVTMQDRPVMIDLARQRGALEAGGVALFAGDFFEAVAGGPFDLVFCAGVTNTFDGGRNTDLYRQVLTCLAPGGCLAIQTSMRDRQPASAMFGVQMLVAGNGGDAHPERLYRRWLADAGYGTDAVLDIDGGRRSLLFATPTSPS